MLGKARINVAGGTAFIEGLDNRPYLLYGGTDDTHDCGALAYVRVEYAGAVFTVNNEINSITCMPTTERMTPSNGSAEPPMASTWSAATGPTIMRIGSLAGAGEYSIWSASSILASV